MRVQLGNRLRATIGATSAERGPYAGEATNPLLSSFSSQDVDPVALTRPGPKLLAPITWSNAGSGGTSSATSGGGELNPFDTDVRSRLAPCGITVVPQVRRRDTGRLRGRAIPRTRTDGVWRSMRMALVPQSCQRASPGPLRSEHLQALG